MAYTPPTLSTLRDSLARDLRDPSKNTFTAAELDDLINNGIVEVSRIYPKQDVKDEDFTSDGQHVWPCTANSLFRVEYVNEDGEVYGGAPPNGHDYTAQGGYDLHGGNLYLPVHFTTKVLVADNRKLRLWGYWPRETLVQDADALDGDAECEFAVRAVAAYMGYQRLQNDRALFQQWMTNTGNSDISPNQLAQTADMYQGQWREVRNRLRYLQRS